jgi:hypothetical protein
MAINLDKQTQKNISHTKRQHKTPKSIRLTKVELQQLEELKERLKELMLSEFCSDTQAFRVLLMLSKHSSKAVIKKALSEIM